MGRVLRSLIWYGCNTGRSRALRAACPGRNPGTQPHPCWPAAWLAETPAGYDAREPPRSSPGGSTEVVLPRETLVVNDVVCSRLAAAEKWPSPGPPHRRRFRRNRPQLTKMIVTMSDARDFELTAADIEGSHYGGGDDGCRSGANPWLLVLAEDLDKLTQRFETDNELRGLRVHRFRYESPRLLRPFSGTRIPDCNDIAQSLPKLPSRSMRPEVIRRSSLTASGSSSSAFLPGCSTKAVGRNSPRSS